MEKLSIKEIIEATQGALIAASTGSELAGEILIESISTNSKDIGKNGLFIPLHGEKMNAHNFINDAFTNGAVATLTDEPVEFFEDKIYIKVKDTLKALQDLASFYRKKFNIPVIGITGSVGKTSTKEMISCVLESRFKVLKTKGNFNGQIGLPLTLFNLTHNHEIAVIEMGISLPNEMQKLSEIATPNYAVISNVGLTHIENFNSQKEIFDEKLKITNSLNRDSTLFINGDNLKDSTVKQNIVENFSIKSFGIKNMANLLGNNISTENRTTTFDLVYNGKIEKFSIPLIGEHNVYNALSAIAVGLEFGVPMEKIKLALKNYNAPKMRQCVCDINFNGKNITLIDDTYNANPDSMKSGLEALEVLGQNKRKIAVLADMLELGNLSEQLHLDIGKFAVNKKVDILLTVGNMAKHIGLGAHEAIANANPNIQIYHFDTNSECIDFVNKILNSNDVILAKGSRGMHLEEFIDNFLKNV